MALPLQPFGLDPPGLEPGWLGPGAGGYLLYRGANGPASIDYDQPVGFAQAGTAQVVTDPAVSDADGTYYYALRALSDAGVLEENEVILRVDIADGSLLSPRPQAPSGGTATPYAGGYLDCQIELDQDGLAVQASEIRLAEIPSGGAAAIDWDNPLAEITVAGGWLHTARVGPWAHGTTVLLAARSFTAEGVGSNVYRLPAAAADAEGPEPVSYIVAETV